MSALSDLQKKLEQEAQGIMFPFSTNANTVSTHKMFMILLLMAL